MKYFILNNEYIFKKLNNEVNIFNNEKILMMK